MVDIHANSATTIAVHNLPHLKGLMQHCMNGMWHINMQRMQKQAVPGKGVWPENRAQFSFGARTVQQGRERIQGDVAGLRCRGALRHEPDALQPPAGSRLVLVVTIIQGLPPNTKRVRLTAGDRSGKWQREFHSCEMNAGRWVSHASPNKNLNELSGNVKAHD